MKKKLLSLFSILILSSCVAITPEQEKNYALYKSDPDPPHLEIEEKNPWTAAAFSLLIPGTGHLYLNEPGYAIIWFFLGLVSPLSAPIAAVADARTVNEINLGEAYKIYLEDKKIKHSPISSATATTTFCHACKYQVREDAKYCSWCGRQRY